MLLQQLALGVKVRAVKDGMKTVVECFGLQLQGDRLVGRRVEVPLTGHPDHDAAQAIGLRAADQDGVAVLHSTSWRWEQEAGALVLTYVCCPDPHIDDCRGDLVAVTRPEQPLGTATRPSPAEHAHGAVLHHGVGHLAWLAEHEPHLVDTSRKEWPRLWGAVLASGRSRAGQLAQPQRISAMGAEPDLVARF